MKFMKKRNYEGSLRKVWSDDKEVCFGVVGIVVEGRLDYVHQLLAVQVGPNRHALSPEGHTMARLENDQGGAVYFNPILKHGKEAWVIKGIGDTVIIGPEAAFIIALFHKLHFNLPFSPSGR